MRPNHGDAWCYFYKFLLENEENIAVAVLNKMRTVEITEGRLWNQIANSEKGWTLSR
jgi:hypothetical protein